MIDDFKISVHFTYPVRFIPRLIVLRLFACEIRKTCLRLAHINNEILGLHQKSVQRRINNLDGSRESLLILRDTLDARTEFQSMTCFEMFLHSIALCQETSFSLDCV